MSAEAPKDCGITAPPAVKKLQCCLPGFLRRFIIPSPEADMRFTGRLEQEKMVEQKGLGNIGVRAIESVVHLLKGRRYSGIRETAAEALGKISWQPKDDVEEVYYMGIRGDRNELVKLGKAGDGKALDALIWALGVFDKNSINSRETLNALGDIGNPEAVEPLIQYVKGIGIYRSFAVVALGKIKDVKAVEVLIEALNEKVEGTEWDPDHGDIMYVTWPLRYPAIEALVKIGDPRAVAPLSDLLKGRYVDTTDQRRAVVALGEIGDGRAVDPLIQVLRDRDSYLRLKAAEALGKIGDKRAIEPLVQLLKDESYSVRENVAVVLGKLNWLPKDDVEKAYCLVAKRDWNELVKLGKAEDGKVVMEPLIHFFKTLDTEWGSRDERNFFGEEIAETFKRIGEGMVESLIRNLTSQDSRIQEGVAISLGKIGDRRALDPLVQALESTSGFAQAAVAKALGDIGDEKAVEPLIRALRSYASPPIKEITEALGKIGGERATATLVQLLTHKYYYNREAAADALGKLNWLPKDDVEKAYCLVAKRDWNELVRLGQAGNKSAIQALNWVSGISCYPLEASTKDIDVETKAKEALRKISNVTGSG